MTDMRPVRLRTSNEQRIRLYNALADQPATQAMVWLMYHDLDIVLAALATARLALERVGDFDTTERTVRIANTALAATALEEDGK